MRLDHRIRKLAAYGLMGAGLLATGLCPGCHNQAGPSSQQQLTQQSKAPYTLYRDPKDVEKIAQQIIDGARPVKGTSPLGALVGDGAAAAIFVPDQWLKANAPQNIKPTDTMWVVMTVDNSKRDTEKGLLETGVRQAVTDLTAIPSCKPAVAEPVVMRVGKSADCPANRITAVSQNNNKAREYEVEVDLQGRKVYILVAGLPGFMGFFPEYTLLPKFLASLNPGPLAKPTPATPASAPGSGANTTNPSH